MSVKQYIYIYIKEKKNTNRRPKKKNVATVPPGTVATI